jgi:hypothetical protein
MRFAFAVITILLAFGARGAVPEGFTPVLVPITPAAFNGAFGSQWITELGIYNAGDEELTVRDVFPFATECPPFPTVDAVPPRAVSGLCVGRTWPAMLLYVKTARLSEIGFSLRIRELTSGIGELTDLPVVRADRFYRRTFRLVAVPLSNSRARTLLRIYDASGGNSRIRLRVWNVSVISTPVPLLEEIVELAAYDNSEIPLYPSYHQRYLDEIGAVRGNVVLEITPLNPESQLWAMVSVTDNVSQSVNVIMPQ